MELLACDAVIFDMDGVVTDTAAIHARAWKRLFVEYLARRDGPDGDGSWRPFDIVDASVIPDVLRGWRILRDVPTMAFNVAPVDSPADGWLVGLYTLSAEPVAARLTETGQKATASDRYWLI